MNRIDWKIAPGTAREQDSLSIEAKWHQYFQVGCEMSDFFCSSTYIPTLTLEVGVRQR